MSFQQLSENVLIVSNGDQGLLFLNTTVKNQPTIISTYSMNHFVFSTTLNSDKTVLLACGNGRLTALNISDIYYGRGTDPVVISQVVSQSSQSY